MESDDYKLCREMHEPHATIEAASAAAKDFFADVYELRKKHRIADVLIVMNVIGIRENGKVAEAVLTGMVGERIREEQMAAYAFGQASAHRQEVIEDAVVQAATFKKLKSKK